LILLGVSGCFFEKETPPKEPDNHTGGSIELMKCGYTVTTRDGASRPDDSVPMLGMDPTPKFVHVNVAGDPRTQMAILWRTNDEDTQVTTVEYGVNGMTDQTETGFTFVYDLNAPLTSNGATEIRMHETHLCGLMPDTEYSYRVGGSVAGTDAWSSVYTFRTAPDRASSPDAQVNMLVIGDTRDGYSTWGSMLQQAMQKGQPDVVLFSGDGTTLGPIQDEWDAWFQAADPILANVPMIVAHGNHDVNAVNWFSQFAMPGDEQNFTVEFGPVHLTVANDTPADPADLQGANAQMLDANLGAGDTAPWNLLMHHKPMFSAAAGPHPNDVVVMRMAWQPIVDAHKVDVVFNGHDHDYERSKPMRGMTPGTTPADGTIYAVVGAAGADLYDAGSSFWTEKSEKTYCFAEVNCRKGMFQFNAFRQDGSALDSFSIMK
jgi:predicted phosphodiesterase